MDPRIENINGITACLRERMEGRKPVLGIVLGSGLGTLADSIRHPVVIPYRDSALGHRRDLVVDAQRQRYLLRTCTVDSEGARAI